LEFYQQKAPFLIYFFYKDKKGQRGKEQTANKKKLNLEQIEQEPKIR
jgi:hypothetical protein